MAISIDLIKGRIEDLLKKNARGRVTASEFNSFVNLASLQLFRHKLPTDKPLKRKVYAQSRLLSEDLNPFKVEDYSLSKSISSKYVLPSDCYYIDAVGHQDSLGNPVPVKEVTEFELRTVLSSRIISPTEEYPVYVEHNGYLKVYPSAINTIQVSYLKTPAEVKWAYTIGPNGREVYDPANSVDLEWNQNCFIELFDRTLKLFGLNLKDTELYRIAEQKELQGS